MTKPFCTLSLVCTFVTPDSIDWQSGQAMIIFFGGGILSEFGPLCQVSKQFSPFRRKFCGPMSGGRPRGYPGGRPRAKTHVVKCRQNSEKKQAWCLPADVHDPRLVRAFKKTSVPEKLRAEFFVPIMQCHACRGAQQKEQMRANVQANARFKHCFVKRAGGENASKLQANAEQTWTNANQTSGHPGLYCEFT